MFRFTIGTADITEYPSIAKFLSDNGLEFSEKQLVAPEENMIKMWKVTQGIRNQSDEIVGACILCKRKDFYVVSDIAVDRPIRKSGLGRFLMKKAEDEIRALGGNQLPIT